MSSASDNTDRIMQDLHATIQALPPVYLWVYDRPEWVFDKVLQLQQAGWVITSISTEYYGWFNLRVRYVIRAYLPIKPPPPPPPPPLNIQIGPITTRPLPSLKIVVGVVSNRPTPRPVKPVIHFRIGPISQR